MSISKDSKEHDSPYRPWACAQTISDRSTSSRRLGLSLSDQMTVQWKNINENVLTREGTPDIDHMFDRRELIRKIKSERLTPRIPSCTVCEPCS